MIVLGIETSCDECAAALLRDGKKILSNVIWSQIEEHRPYNGVVPEIASRRHTETIRLVVEQALRDAGLHASAVDGLAVTYRPGLVGSLLVGLNFAKALAYALGKPFVGVDHIEAHLYAAHIGAEIDFPYIGLLVSGGHTLITVVRGYFDFDVVGTTIDDACGEAFDKIAKYYDMGYPGGVAVQRLAAKGDPQAFAFPKPSLHKGDHRYDVSYSGLKTAVVNQLMQFLRNGYANTPENLAASFQHTAVTILVDRVKKAVKDFGIRTVVAGGGVAANEYLRACLGAEDSLDAIFPSLVLCTDNAAMIAGTGYHQLSRGMRSPYDLNAAARVAEFRRTYP